MIDRDLLKNEHVCGCGTFRQALDEALAEFQRSEEDPDKCASWYLTHVVASAYIVQLLATRAALGGDTTFRATVLRAQLIMSSDEVLTYIDAQIVAIIEKPEMVS